MESQVFLPAAYSLRTEDLFPADDFEDEDTMQRQEYCRVALTVDRRRILDVVLSDLDCDESLLYEAIDEARMTPYEPGNLKTNISDDAKLGRAIKHLIAKACDDQVGLRMAVKE